MCDPADNSLTSEPLVYEESEDSFAGLNSTNTQECTEYERSSTQESSEYESSSANGSGVIVGSDVSVCSSEKDIKEWSPKLFEDSVASEHIFSFSDDTPPRILAPPIAEEDLWESFATSGSEEHAELMSSELPSSGSSTDSQPFDNAYFENPVMTSTPLKSKRGKPRQSLYKKKVTEGAIRSARNACGCQRSCTGKSFFSSSSIKKMRTTLWTKSLKERQLWIQEKIDDFMKDGKKVLFQLKGELVCQKAWLKAYGICQSSFYTIFEKKKMNSTSASMNDLTMEACVWFGEYIALHAESLPNSGAKWLPYGTTAKELYNVYLQKFDSVSTICYQTFLNMWKKCYHHVKIKKSNLFTRCNSCVQLDMRLHATVTQKVRNEIMMQKQRHLHRIMMEKTAYYRRRDIARRRPDRYVSLIIDGMDQAKTYIPHFVGRKSKEIATASQLKVHVTGVISHGTNEKRVFTDIFQYRHDANLTMNVLLKNLWDISKGKPLPPVLYLQADNCFRENKNKFVLALLELLVHKEVFYEIQMSFLYVGHTHEDIDQMFSTIADTLRKEKALTLEELHSKMPCATSLGGCFDISSWLAPHLSLPRNHSKTGMFRFRKSTEGVKIYYRKNSDQTWKTLGGSFFKLINNKVSLPTGVGNVLFPFLERIDLELLKDSLKTWRVYFRLTNSFISGIWWETFLNKLGQRLGSERLLKQWGRENAVWVIGKFSQYNRQALEDETNEQALPQEVMDRLAAEEANPEVILNSFFF
ncbi:hypothetical protein ScPMuIL_005146 [Solemya velum]